MRVTIDVDRKTIQVLDNVEINDLIELVKRKDLLDYKLISATMSGVINKNDLMQKYNISHLDKIG